MNFLMILIISLSLTWQAFSSEIDYPGKDYKYQTRTNGQKLLGKENGDLLVSVEINVNNEQDQYFNSGQIFMCMDSLGNIKWQHQFTSDTNQTQHFRMRNLFYHEGMNISNMTFWDTKFYGVKVDNESDLLSFGYDSKYRLAGQQGASALLPNGKLLVTDSYRDSTYFEIWNLDFEREERYFNDKIDTNLWAEATYKFNHYPTLLPDESFIIDFNQDRKSDLHREVAVARYDKDFNQMWRVFIEPYEDGKLKESGVYGMDVLANGNIINVGSYKRPLYPPDPKVYFAMIHDTDGNLLHKNLFPEDSLMDYRYMTPLPGGGFAVAGFIKNTNKDYDIVIAKYNSQGEKTKFLQINSPDKKEIVGDIIYHNNKIYITGNRDDDLLIFSIDLDLTPTSVYESTINVNSIQMYYSNNALQIKNNSQKNKEINSIEIYDISGKLQEQIDQGFVLKSSSSIPIRKLRKGIYLIKLNSNGAYVTSKIMVD